MSLNHEQSPGEDPTSSKATKRNSGLFSIFKWFKTLSRESLTEVISSSSSTDSLTSIQSNATVASFSFVQPNQYVKQTEKIILEDREDTDTLKARLKHRDEVRESDRNVTLRKKYNLFLFRDTFLRPSKKEEDNTKSLPLMATTQMDLDQNVSGHRRTNSDSSKIKKAGSYLHVKGKRRAPQPPTVNKIDSASLRRVKKRPAPAKPAVTEKDSPETENRYETINFTSEDVLVNDSLKLDHGILKQTKNVESVDNLKPSSARTSYVEPLGSSPKPWYKRTSSKEPHHKELERTPSERLPEVQYSRNSASAEKQVTQERQEQNKRKSGMSFLTNISELDREATELFKLQKNGSATSVNSRSVVVAEMPEFMRPKTDTKITPDNTTTKKKGARDLIAKFNAITSATKVTVNLFGNNQKRKEYFGRSVSHEDRRHQETLLDAHKRRIESIDKRINVQPIGLMKSESASAVKKPDTPKCERKTWSCPKCYLDNEYWRIICHVCSAIKPYFDEVTPVSKEQKFIPKSPLVKPKNSPERFLERSRTQIGFSALANFNNNVFPKEITLEDEKIKEDKEKLKKMLIEMKNSLPKRKLNGVAAKPNQNRASIIVEKEEVLDIKDKSLNDKEVQKIGATNASAKIDGPQEVKVTKIANPQKVDVIKVEQPPKIYPKLDLLAVDPPKNKKLDSAKTQEEMVCEILIGTKQTIYENIKVKKTEIPKPVKVSSSAQTSSIVNKTPTNITSLQTAAVKAVIKKKNSFEPMKPSEFNDIYSEKNGQTSAARIYANLARNDELSLFFNVPKNLCDFKNNLKLNHDGKTDTIEINRLLRRLEISIAKGELNEAAIFAKELAQLKVNCSVVRQKLSDEEPTLKKNCLSIDMYVEDQISHRGPFTLQVSESQTVLNLKKQVEKEFQIPVNVQRWILGKELATNDEATLKECHVTSNGCPVFLYLVAPTEQKASTSSKNTPISTDKNNLILDSKSSDIVPPKIITITPAKNVEKEPDNPNLATAVVTTTIVNYCPPKIINLLPKNNQIPSNSEAKNIPPEINTKEKISTKEKTTPLVENTTGDLKIKQESSKILPEVEKKHEEPIIKVNILKPEEVLKKATLEDDFDYFSKTLRPQNKTEWECHLCTLLNPLSSNICAVCATVRQKNKIKSLKRKKAPKVPIDEYLQLVNLDNADLVSNSDQFECLVCFLDILPKEGVTLRECLHQFCKECLKHTIQFSEDAEVKCPYRDEQYSCNTALQDREIKALVTTEVYNQFLAKSVAQAENKMDKTFHCKTPDCKGWCIFEDNVNEFRCPVCRRANCLTCQAIHIGLNCKEYQEKMNDESDIDESARQTKKMLQEMVDKGEALNCPTCQVILIKKWGCDWLRCSMCKTEICWVTRGPRWGPAGKGDISGGCQCGLKGVKCHPKCNYCH